MMGPDALALALWAGPLADGAARDCQLSAEIAGGAGYDAALAGLRNLWRFGLPGAQAALAAQRQWPLSIDIAVLACDLAPPARLGHNLEHLRAAVLHQNRRRAALAGACLRAGRPDLARDALAQIDPASPTAADDIHRRAELALARGDYMAALADISWLHAQGRAAEAETLHLRLIYRRDGAKGMAACLDMAQTGAPAFWAQGFELALQEGDFGLVRQVLARWAACPSAPPLALARASSRLALETGNLADALALLEARLDVARPWAWDATDHVQWLRIGQGLHHDPAQLLAHAEAARRLHARHDWLFHITHGLREGAQDWRALAAAPRLCQRQPERALSAAHYALRLGLPGRAALELAGARRMAAGPEALRMVFLRAEGFRQAGRISAAHAALARAQGWPQDAPQRAEMALAQAELALMEGQGEQAQAALRPALLAFPDRMSVQLTVARIAFLQGAFGQAQAAHARFNARKAAQLGQSPPPDLRDRIVDDAAFAARDCAGAFAPGHAPHTIIATAGAAHIATSPGLAAHVMARARAQGALRFCPDPAAEIPRQIAHYWQGPPGPATQRAAARWAQLHPGFAIHLFNTTSAADWLAQNYGPEMAARFARVTQPALRADLFRLCWIAREGGIFTDLDEYPRLPVTPWLDGAGAVLCIEQGFGTIANNFIAARAGHPVCALALAHVCAALDGTEAPYAWWHSGPAQWTRAAFAVQFVTGPQDIRFLSQAQYLRHVATNLPYPHKRSPDHWR
ncbi:MAG: hypothetical protein LAT78_01745 [Roseinatronobacter sp.]|nr:hypothetical protein [Roseinatronobacter sp.]